MNNKMIAEFTNKNKQLTIISRDEHGKWYVSVNGIFTQRKLNASEIVRYLTNALEGN
jgi:hypothetical protein